MPDPFIGIWCQYKMLPYWQPTMNRFGSRSMQLYRIYLFWIVILSNYIYIYYSGSSLSRLPFGPYPTNRWHARGKVPCTSNPQSTTSLLVQYIQNTLLQGVESCLILLLRLFSSTWPQLLILLQFADSVWLRLLCFGSGISCVFGVDWLFCCDCSYFVPIFLQWLLLLYIFVGWLFSPGC